MGKSTLGNVVQYIVSLDAVLFPCRNYIYMCCAYKILYMFMCTFICRLSSSSIVKHRITSNLIEEKKNIKKYTATAAAAETESDINTDTHNNIKHTLASLDGSNKLPMAFPPL